MGNQNVKPAKRPAQVYPFNDSDKKSRTDWTAGKSVAIPDSGPGRGCFLALPEIPWLTILQFYQLILNSSW